MATVAFWSMAYGFAVGRAGTPGGGGGNPDNIAVFGIALSLMSVPVAFVVAAWVSRKPDWPIGALAAMGLSLVVGLPLLWFQNPLASLLAGLAAGAAVAVSRPAGMSWHHRAVAAAVVVVLVLVGMSSDVLFVPTAVLGPALPFMAAGLSDLFVPRHVGMGQ